MDNSFAVTSVSLSPASTLPSPMLSFPPVPSDTFVAFIFRLPSFASVNVDAWPLDPKLIPLAVNCMAFPSTVEKDLSPTAPFAETEPDPPLMRMACTAIPDVSSQF